MTRWKAAVVLVPVVLTALIAATWKRWWLRASGYTVTYGGQEAPEAVVYRGSDCFLVDLTRVGDSLYLVYPAARELGEAQAKRFIFFPRVTFSKDLPARWVWIGKSDVLAAIDFRQKAVAFTGVKAKRVVVAWHAP
jgi:hypothetical protein